MHESSGHGDGGPNSHVNHHDGSVGSQAGPIPGTEPIPDGVAGPESGGSSRYRRPGSRIHAGLPSWDIRAKIAVVVSFVVLVAVLVMNRPRLKGKENSAPLAEISKRTSADKLSENGVQPKPDDHVPAKDETDTPPAAPTATGDAALANGAKPPPTPISEAQAKGLTNGGEKTPAQVTDENDVTPSLDSPATKTTESKSAGTALADAPIPPLDDKKPKDDPVPVDEKTPRLDGDKPPTPDSIESVPKAVPDDPTTPVASMPPLSKAPSTAEPNKAATTDMPATGNTDASNEGRFAIPSAGLVRTSDTASKKTVPGDVSGPVSAAKPPASVPGTGNDDGTLHVVRRGENFWTIARYHYASGRFYKALWYANRDLAKTPEDLYVGTAIRIPPVEDLNRDMIEAPKTARVDPRPTAAAPARKTSPRDGRTERTAVEGDPQTSLPLDKKDSGIPIPRRTETRPKPEAPYRTYVVRGRNETLRSVARTQLGDSDRDAEIEALNRDEFSDDSTRLKVGMTLKLPSDSRTR